MIAVFLWALVRYPVMGIRIDAPSRPVLEALMGASCVIGSLTTVGAAIAAYSAVAHWRATPSTWPAPKVTRSVELR